MLVNPTILILVAIFGACIGSFLNVVIYRLPIMLEQLWQQQAKQVCTASVSLATTTRFNLSVPRSHCPTCQRTIRWWQNIPLISYIFLQGKCHYCDHKIPFRYFFIELISALFPVLLMLQYSSIIQVLALMSLLYASLALLFIDLDHQILPDEITLPFIWLGLLINLVVPFASIDDSVIGAVAGYLSLWLIMQAYRLVTGKIGIGYGDFKLLALFGAWFGWQSLPTILFFAALLGLIIGGGYLVITLKSQQTPIPFGPFIIVASLSCYFFHIDSLINTIVAVPL